MRRKLIKAALDRDRKTFDSLLETLYYETVDASLLMLALPQITATAVRESFNFPFTAVFSFDLSSPQIQAIENYRNRLLEGDMRALKSSLRDKRFDRSLLSSKIRPVDSARVERMVEQYRTRTQRSQAAKVSKLAITMVRGRAQWVAALHAFRNGFEIEKLWRGGSDRHEKHNLLGYVDLFHNYGTGSEILRYSGDSSAEFGNVVGCGCRMLYRVKR